MATYQTSPFSLTPEQQAAARTPQQLAAAGSPTDTSITSASLTPTPSIDYSTPQYSAPYPTGTLTPPPLQQTGPEGQASDISKALQNLTEQQAGKAQFTNDQYAKLGYGTQTDASGNIVANDPASADLTAKLTQLTNEANAIPLQLQNGAQGQEISQAGLAPHQTDALRTNAIEALGVSSLIAARNGNLVHAKMLVDNAVNQKYGPIEAEIAAKTKNLQLILNSPEYTLADKNRAQQQKAIIDQQTADIAKKKEDTATIQSWAAAALKNGASALQAKAIMDVALSDNPDLSKALTLYSPFATDPNATKLAVLELTNKRLQNDKLQADINKLNADTATAGVALITNPQAAKYAGALSVILGSAKFTKDQKNSVVDAVNNGEDPLAIIKNQAKQVMTGANQTKVESYETAQQSLKAVSDDLVKYYAAGGKTNIFAGNYEKVVNKLGQVNDPKLVELATAIQQSLQIYRNAVSGTAYSVQEGNDIASIFPGIQKSEGLNNAIITGRMKAFSDGIDGAYRGVLGSTYDSIKGGVSAPLNGKSVTVQGKTYVVGQIYEDANGRWTVDAQGKWTKQ